MKLLSSLSIKARVLLSFTLVLVIFLGFSRYTLSEINVLGELTEDLYQHPLQVSNAALRASTGMIRMHRDMKDVALSTQDFELNESVSAVREAERQVYADLALIKREILGDQGLELQRVTMALFADWKPIRDEVIRLIQQGQRDAAVRITKGKGAQHVALLERQFLELSNYARNKADSFMVQAHQTQANIRRYTLLIVGAVLLLLTTIALLLVRAIISPLGHLKETMAQITQTGDLVKAEVGGSDEIAAMAGHFNTLVDSLAHQFWYRNGIAALNESLSGEVEFERLLDIATNAVGRYAEACFAAIYTYDKAHSSCQLQSTYAYVATPFLANQFGHGEGVVGQVALDKRAVLLNDIARQEGGIQTGVIDERAVSLYAIPLLYQGELHGVLAVATFQSIDEAHKEYLDRAAEVIGNMLFTAGQRKQISALLDVSQRANEELQAQSEELKAQSGELKSQYHELEQRRLEVEQADRLKSEFLSNMSHELRTPLNSIMALSQLMIERGPGNKPEQDGKYLQVIERNGRQLLNLINDILDLSKIESGHINLYCTDFSPALLIRQAVDTVRPLGEEKGLGLEVELEALPQMYCDEGRLRQIVLNLLSNATKFTHEGAVRLQARVVDESIRIEVGDSGIGIESDDLEHIFNEFRQVDGSTTRDYEGTGLGLAISRKIAHLLGGDITVESEPGIGSTFTLTVPLNYREAADTEPSALLVEQAAAPSLTASAATAGGQGRAAPRPATQTGAGLRRTIMVADDEPETCTLLEAFLVGSGYEVVIVNEGRRVVELAEQLMPFAITLDVLMPEVDGFEVLHRLKENPATAQIPVVMISVSDNRDTAFALGAAGYLVKPVSRDALDYEVSKVAEQGRVERLLVVDDDAITRNHLKTSLESSGYRVDTAMGGKEALEMIARSRPDALVLDLMMPEVDGFAVIDGLRAAGISDLPIIVVTAKDLNESDRKRLSGAVKQTLTKSGVEKSSFFHQLDSALLQIGGRHQAPGLNVLVVEDNQVAAEQVRSALEQAGLRVQTAADGAEALASIATVIPQLVVLDLMMPGIDGFEVLTQIRSKPWTEHLPVIVLTAKELTRADHAKLAKNSVEHLVQKGNIDKQKLVDTVFMLLKPRPAMVSVTAPEQPVDAVPEPVTTAPPKGRPAAGDSTILIVEDNPDNLFTLSALLDQADYRYISAADGRAGVEMAREHHPGLILMDMQLPVLSGADATREIKGDPALAAIPIIAVTARAMAGERERALGVGCDDYLSKPIDNKALLTLLETWMPEHHKEKQSD